MKKLILGAVALAAFGAPAYAGPNLLINGSFESGFAGWTPGGVSDDGFPPVVISFNNSDGYPLGAYGEPIPVDDVTVGSSDGAGNYGAYFVADEAHPQTLSQTISWIAGHTYTFGFDIYVPFNGAANQNDASFASVVGGYGFTSFLASDLTAGVWQHVEGTGVAGSTGTFGFDFEFSSFGIPAKDFVIDRVFLSDNSVPEPASWALMLVGFGLAGVAMRSRRRAMVTFS